MFFIKSSSLHLKTIWLFLFLISTVITLTACNNKEDVTPKVLDTIKIAVSKTPLSAPLFIAKELGYFAEQGLDAELVMTIGGHRCLASILAGETDMGTVSDYPIMINSFKRQDYAVAATFVSSSNDVKLIANKNKGITTPADLKHKKIGTVAGASSHFFLDQFLLFNGLSLADVEVIPLKSNDMPKALQDGKVDALSVWEPYGFLTKQLLQDDAIIFPSKNYYRETFNLVIGQQYIADNPKVIVAVLRALDKAETFINQKPREAQKILIKHLQLNEKFIDWIWKDFNFQLSLDQSLIKTLEAEADWAITNKIIARTQKQNYVNFIYLDALDVVDKPAITVIR